MAAEGKLAATVNCDGDVFEDSADTSAQDAEDAAYNSYHYWRTPVSTVDVTSLLADLLLDSSTDDIVDEGSSEPSNHHPHIADPAADSAATGAAADAECCTSAVGLDSGPTPPAVVDSTHSEEDCGVSDTDSTCPSGVVSSDADGLADATASAHTAPLLVPLELIEHYNIMSEKSSTKNIDSDITRICAFTLPAIVWALGSAHWHHIRDTYVRLAGDYDWKIRLTLAHSTHICALILGKEITEQELLPNFANFLKDWEEVSFALARPWAVCYFAQHN